jgi:hypothetical protein
VIETFLGKRRFTTKTQRTQRKTKEEFDLRKHFSFFVFPLCSLCLCGECLL